MKQTKEQKLAAKAEAKEQAKEDRKAVRSWNEFINRLTARKALVELIEPKKQH